MKLRQRIWARGTVQHQTKADFDRQVKTQYFHIGTTYTGTDSFTIV